MASTGKGATTHNKLHTLLGWGLIIGLPFALASAVCAIGGGTEQNPAQGFIDWLSAPLGAIGFLAFALAAIWYCKLEFEELALDYFGGGTLKLALLANKLIAIFTFLAMAYAVIKLAFLG